MASLFRRKQVPPYRRKLHFEALEARLLLSADLTPVVAPFAARDSGDIQSIVEILSAAPQLELAGLYRVDSSPEPLQGQFVVLDFDGEQGVTYAGPVRIEGVEVSAFHALDSLAGQETAIQDSLLEQLNQRFAGSGIRFTDAPPDAGSEHSTVYIGADVTALADLGHFYGLAESVDVGNQDRSDIAFVQAGTLYRQGMAVADFTAALSEVIAHETGHLLGYAHIGQDLAALNTLDAVAATVSWATDNNGYWDVASNWSTGSVPGADDVVVIDRAGANPTVTLRSGAQSIKSLDSRESLVMSGGSLTLAEESRIEGPFTLSGGTVTANAPLTLAGTSVLSGGTLMGAVSNSGTLTIAANTTLKDTTLSNLGTVIHDNGVVYYNNATLDNLGLYDIRDSGTLTSVSGGTIYTLRNSGTLRKNETGIATLSGVSFDNAASGRVEVLAGSLNIAKGNSIGGVFEVANGAALELSGAHTLAGNYSGSGQGVVQISGVMTAGSGGAGFDLTGLEMSGGTLQGAAGFSNSGTLTIAANTTLKDTTLSNLGTVIHDNGVVYYNNATLDNLGLYDIRDSGTLTSVSGGTIYTLRNSGTLRKNETGIATLSGVSFDNAASGRVEVLAGSLNLSNVAQLSGGVLSGGAWHVIGNATLSLGGAITRNQGEILLQGAGSTWANLSGLNLNEGELILLDRVFTRTGNFTNDGRLELGAAGNLNVTGNFTQGSTATLVFQIAGTPASGQFGHLGVSGQAALDGALDIALAEGFGPSAGQSFQLMDFASQTGGFASITGLAVGEVTFFAERITTASLFLDVLVDAGDLEVLPLVVPPEAIAGQPVSLNFTVRNRGATSSAVADWVDSLWLSGDEWLDAGDILIGTVPHTGVLAADTPYDAVYSGPLPDVPAGNYRLIVVADSNAEVPDLDRGNNAVASAASIHVSRQPPAAAGDGHEPERRRRWPRSS